MYGLLNVNAHFGTHDSNLLSSAVINEVNIEPTDRPGFYQFTMSGEWQGNPVEATLVLNLVDFDRLRRDMDEVHWKVPE